jgi:Transposase, Mutator family
MAVTGGLRLEKRTKKWELPPDLAPMSLGELIHRWVRRAIETAVHEGLEAALGAARHERNGERRGYRNGTSERTLTGPTGSLALTLPRHAAHRHRPHRMALGAGAPVHPPPAGGERGRGRDLPGRRQLRAITVSYGPAIALCDGLRAG